MEQNCSRYIQSLNSQKDLKAQIKELQNKLKMEKELSDLLKKSILETMILSNTLRLTFENASFFRVYKVPKVGSQVIKKRSKAIIRSAEHKNYIRGKLTEWSLPDVDTKLEELCKTKTEYQSIDKDNPPIANVVNRLRVFIK